MENPTRESELLDEVSRQRQILVLRWPFFGSLVLRLRPRAAQPADGVTTAAVAPDGTVVFAEDFWFGLSSAQKLGLVAHESGHPALGHFGLLGKFDKEIANKAADYAWNPLILDAGLSLPPDALIDRYEWADKCSEEIAKELTKRRGPQPPPQGGGQGEGNGMRPDLSSTELGKKAASGDEAAKEELAVQNRQALADAITTARQKGDVPGALENIVNEILYPKLSLRSKLLRFMGSKGPRVDRNMLRPSRRAVAVGLPLPSRKATAPTVCVATDVSGSMSDEEFKKAKGVIERITEELRIDLLHIQWDTKIQKVEEGIMSASDTGSRRGYGGSNCQCVYDYLKKTDFDGVVVVITDGYIDAPRKEPNGRIQGTLWLLVQKDQEPPVKWGAAANLGD